MTPIELAEKLVGPLDEYDIPPLHEAAAMLKSISAANKQLVDALNAMLTHMGMDEDEWNKPTFDQAREAIKKFNGGNL